MERVIAVLIGYVFGLFQTAFFYGKLKGIDIREHGSGNSGTTNALRVLGPKAGLIVFLGDCLKCIIAIWIVRLLFGQRHEDMIQLLCLYSCAGAVLGHNYPFYMNFKGGKGIAVTAGMVIAFDPWFMVIGVVTFFSIFFTTHFVSLCSLVTYFLLLVTLIIMGQCGYFPLMSQGELLEAYIVFALLTLLAFWKHRENIKRLLSGTERKTYLSKKNKVD
ncbi:MAG: glycerol-3-phosphate 1-O-acyltransferase PlsY [Lachnospiraceae bacterium]|jgi:glycerol-3-phosphate acyltransferase PlsY|nr:glycerol-3-phosphate 1-O-acyltransferase PlsY [Lachnospiraceae bacterium]